MAQIDICRRGDVAADPARPVVLRALVDDVPSSPRPRPGARGSAGTDAGTGRAPVDLRVVVAGASTAGKATTARALGQRLGRRVVAPEGQDGRPLLFDWMDHEGGPSHGRAIHAQLVTVPGHLPHLRADLLGTADVVLFVADTSSTGLHASEVELLQVRALLEACEGLPPGLVIQANKRDAIDALPMHEVRRRLTTADHEPVVETVARTGEGVRRSFACAVRLGLQHARAVEELRFAG